MVRNKKGKVVWEKTVDSKEFGFNFVGNGELLKVFKHKTKIVRVIFQPN